MPEIPTLHPAIALVGYAESLVDGRRVVLCGDATTDLAERLLERGARLVQVCDPDPVRVAEAAALNTSRNIAFAPLGEGGIGVRDGAFDLLLVPDLSLFEHPAAVLRKLQRFLQNRGAALIASPNREARARLLPAPRGGSPLDYYALYDLVSAEFDHVRMLGQTPFVGYAVADFAPDGEIEPAIDTAFLPGGAEEPEWFIALASRHAVSLDAYAIVELPADQVMVSPAPAPDALALEQELGDARTDAELARARVAELEAERAARPTDAAHAAELVRLQQQLDKRDQWIRRIEERASTADARADEAQEQLEESHAKVTTLEKRVAELEGARGSAQNRVAELEGARGSSQSRLAELETARTRALARTAELEGTSGKAQQRIAELEAALTAANARLSEASQRFLEERSHLDRELGQARSSARTELGQVQARLAQAQTRLEEARHGMSAELSLAQADVGRLQAEVNRIHPELGRLQVELGRAEAELSRVRAEAESARKEAEQGRTELIAARSHALTKEQELAAQLTQTREERDAALRAAQEIPHALEQESLAELGSLEAQLRERAQVITDLERKLKEARRTGRELVLRLEDLSSSPKAAEILARLAEKEADLEASQWTIELLAGKLARATQGSPTPNPEPPSASAPEPGSPSASAPEPEPASAPEPEPASPSPSAPEPEPASPAADPTPDAVGDCLEPVSAEVPSFSPEQDICAASSVQTISDPTDTLAPEARD